MIVLDDDRARLDVARIHGWLASSFWSPGADAHGGYGALGFHPPLRPDRYIERLSPDAAAMLQAAP